MKNLIPVVTLSAVLVTGTAFARPDFAGQNMRSMSQEDRVAIISDRLAEQGLTQDEIQARLATIQERMDSHEGRMQRHGNMEDRTARIQDRMATSGLSEAEIQEKMADREVFQAELAELSPEERLEKIAERMAENGLSQEQIDENLVRISARMESSL